MRDAAQAEERFRAFQNAMHGWETKFEPLYREDAAKHAPQAKVELIVVFDEYVYNYRTDYGRRTGPDLGYPPDYDPSNYVIARVESGRSKVKVYVKKGSQSVRTSDTPSACTKVAG